MDDGDGPPPPPPPPAPAVGGFPGSGLLTAAVRHVSDMFQSFLTSSLNWEEFLEALNAPEQLGAFVQEHERALGLHLLFLSQVLRVNPESALNGPHAAENFDRATFGIGQVISHEPAVASRLPCALTLVESLASAVRYGWDIHHGVAKFAANSMVILATCPEAEPAARLAALGGLYDGMLVWLGDTTERADGSDICGCSCSRPATSATCWVERLLTQPDDLVTQWFLEKENLEDWLIALVRAVREQHGNPFCITHLLQIDGMATRLMASDAIVESTDLEPEPEPEPEPQMQLEPEPEPEPDASSVLPAPVFKPAEAATSADGGVVPPPVDDDADNAKPLNRLPIGEDIMSCLSFAMLTIDDSYFGEQAAIVLLKMAREPAGLDRLLSHATSIPMMEGVATTACFHGAAIKLLDVVCEDERGRACVRSLVEALCEEPKPLEKQGQQQQEMEAAGDPDEGSQQVPGPTVASAEELDQSVDGDMVGSGRTSGTDKYGDAETSAAHCDDEGSPGSGDDGDDGDGESEGDDEAEVQDEGKEEEVPTWQWFKNRVHTTLRGVTAASLGAEIVAAGSTAPVPPWPHPSLEPDLAKAFGLTEILGENSGERQARLVERMDTAEKRVWLNQRLFRAHQGDQLDDDLAEEPLAFIECDREGCPLSEMRLQWEEKTGIGDDISGYVEVRFKGESSVGSAVLREWMAHAVTAGFLNAKNNLLASNDGGRTFTLSPSRHETHPETYLLDYEILGRFVGAAMLHRVCVGVRFSPSFCRLILSDNSAWAWDDDDVREFDPLLHRNLVEYVRAADEDDLADLELTFTDVQDWFADAVEGNRVSPAVAQASVDLITGGSDVAVTTANRADFIEAVVERRLFGSIEEQTSAFLSGLHTVVPPQIFHSLRGEADAGPFFICKSRSSCNRIVTQNVYLSVVRWTGMITPAELQDLIAGLATINIEDWKKHTQ